MNFILLNRFALPFSPENPRQRYYTTINNPEEWWEKRLALFKKYTVPSVEAQIFKRFEWFLVVGKQFPLSSKYGAILTGIRDVLWVDCFWNEEAQPEIGAALYSKGYRGWVCTTRLDNDDIISNNFMERLSEKAAQEEKWYSFHYGFMMKDNLVYPRNYPKNPFISYTEYATESLRGVFYKTHIHADNPIELGAKDEPGWIQVDHGENIKNSVEGKGLAKRVTSFPSYELRNRFTWNAH